MMPAWASQVIQGAPFLFQVAMTEFLTGVKEDIGLK
jgi:hypothetical protein